LYQIYCSPNAPDHFIEIGKKSLITPPGWNPNPTRHGAQGNVAQNMVLHQISHNFETMNRISENSNSVRDVNDDINDVASNTEVSEIDSFQEKRLSE
jgi:hypothetical protein